jgi:APA family basic amino acid/polyamine antiporter
MAELKRQLGLWTSVSIVVGTVIGSSIFMKPASMAAALGSPLLLLLVWIVAGTVSLFGAMINAELGAMMPDTGGQYIYLRAAYGKFVAYLFGWAGFVVINTAAIAGIAFVFAQYAEYFFTLPRFGKEMEQAVCISIPLVGKFYLLENIGVKGLAILLILILTVLNVRSVKASGGLQVALSVLKVAALAFLAIAIFVSGKGMWSNLSVPSQSYHYTFWTTLSGFIAATTGALAAYDGWSNLGYVAGEIRDPQRNLPLGLILGLSICIVLYVLTTEAYLYVLPVDVMKGSTIVAADALSKVLGVAGGAFVALLVMTSTAGGTNGNIMPSARVTYAMSEEGNFFRFAGKVNPRFFTPANALWLQAIWCCLLVLLGSFDMLMNMFIFVTWIFYGFVAYAIFIFRRRAPDAERPYRMRGYPLLPIIFIAFTVLYIGITLYNDIADYQAGRVPIINSVFGLVLTGIGVPFYWLFRKRDLTGKTA